MLTAARAMEFVVDALRLELLRLRSAGVPVAEDDYRGLHIPDGEVDRILARIPEPPELAEERDRLLMRLEVMLAEAEGRIGRLIRVFQLNPFEAAVVLLCLAAESDLAIERLIAYAQDDVSKRRPRVDLAVRSFSASGEHRWADSFHAASALRRWNLVQLLDEPGQPATPLRARYLALEPGLAAYLMGSDEVDESLAPNARLIACPSTGSDDEPGRDFVRRVAGIPLSTLERPVVALEDGDGRMREECAAALARQGGMGLIDADLQRLLERHPMERCVGLLLRDGALHNAAVFIRQTNELTSREWGDLCALLEDGFPAPAVLLETTSTRPPWRGLTVQVPSLDFDQRRALWDREFAANSALDTGVIDQLAETFQLGTAEIQAAGRIAAGTATWRSPDGNTPTADDAFAAARAASNPVLTNLARRIAPRYSWGDIVLPDDALAQLRELSERVRHAHTVLDVWAFNSKAAGRGVVALFAGPSGTGKTMAAEIVARELQLDLYAIDLSGVVSKYIGETEKNLESIFKEASTSNALLFFDEADALFGKRSEVKDAHDRYANIETAYLLQRIEAYQGPVIMATNLKLNLDDAFVRRLDFSIDFPFPEEEERLRIWRSAFPPAAPQEADIDFPFLAHQFRLTGGNIRNIALASAYLAATERESIAMKHIVAAVKREYQKLGRMITDADFGRGGAGL